jgi:hypothetical protein
VLSKNTFLLFFHDDDDRGFSIKFSDPGMLWRNCYELDSQVTFWKE